MKIVLPDIKTLTEGDLDLSVLEQFGEVIAYPLTEFKEIAGRIADADVVLCNKTLMNAETLKDAGKLQYIGLFATGYNNVDLEYTNAHNITVCNAGSYSTDAVAQHTLALLLNYYGRIREYAAYTASGGWTHSDIFCSFAYPMQEIAGKTLGIIGFGSIGQRVAEIALAFRMKVLVSSGTWSKAEETCRELFMKAYEEDFIEVTDLETLVSESDVVTVHCPLNDRSERMINRSLLEKFKPSAYLINTSRGGIIDEEALYHALEEGRIAGAALDVMQTEPMPENCRLLGAKNLVITPHVAWAPLETRQRLLDIAVDNLDNYQKGTPKHVIRK
ncbi:MAG: D-2-hydroxyacid dehydrogenase [Lachnospiraceae bacterium]|nr:D-2-hydroxyacid dehydrogenase [Lachnospiraceae bacterium]